MRYSDFVWLQFPRSRLPLSLLLSLRLLLRLKRAEQVAVQQAVQALQVPQSVERPQLCWEL